MKAYVLVREIGFGDRFDTRLDNVVKMYTGDEKIYTKDMLDLEKIQIKKFKVQDFKKDFEPKFAGGKYIPIEVPDNLQESERLYMRTIRTWYGDWGDDVAGNVCVLKDAKLYDEEMMKRENIKSLGIDEYGEEFISFKVPEHFWELYKKNKN